VSRRSLNTRLYLVFLFFVLFFLLLIIRLSYVQVVKSKKFSKLAGEQHKIFTEIAPLRGIIFDREVQKLAINAVSYSIFSTKQTVADEKIQAKLADILELDQSVLSSKLNSDKSFVWLTRKISPEVSTRVRALNIPGIGQLRENKRFYPNSSLASHVIGFTDIDNKGLEGIELFSNPYLSGIKGWRLAQRDAKRQEVICWGYKSILPTDGYNVVLTIDSVIQSIAERHLRRAASKYKASSATVIVMDPKTGEILALYNYPDYNLNAIGDYDSAVRKNLAITDIFEPGSSFKFVLAAAALEEGIVDAEDKIFCEKGEYKTNGRILHDYKPYGEISFKEVIEYSSNIGVAKVAEDLGPDLLYDYIRDFGFGTLTAVDLPGEVKGIIRPPSKWSRLSISSLPMGQEIAVTPIQLVCAISSIANDGVLLRPRIIKEIIRKDDKVIKSFPKYQVRRVVSEETADIVKDMLAGVVENGTGKKAKVSGHPTAGKTGTAQKPKPQGGYYKNKYVASFVGFVPVQDPRLAILVVLNEPRPQYFGGTVCAPVFKKIATETLRYLEMNKDIIKNQN